MSDPFDAAGRSAVMRAVRSADTGPERAVRAMVRGLGAGYRLGGWNLPGKPDLVFPGRRQAIFIHGCFWHGHDCARGARQPKTNAAYWRAKISRNRARDEWALQELCALGWGSLVIWECALKDEAACRARLAAFLTPESASTAPH